MVYKFDKTSYGSLHPLFEPLVYHPMWMAVLDCVYPGEVYVDDPDTPGTAFLSTFITSQDDGVWGYLVGNPENEAFNQALNQAILGREIIGQSTPVLLLTCYPEDWHGRLGELFAPRAPTPMPRRHYICRELNYDWRAHLPAGFSMHPLSTALLSRPRLTVPEEVRKTAGKWDSYAGMGMRDFGFVVVHDDPKVGGAQVVSWATVDFVTRVGGDAGVFTVDKYRQRGLATIAAAAAVEYGLAQGLSFVNWTCAKDNPGSIRTAEKLGFERLSDYKMHLLIFDETQSIAQLAYQTLQAGDYQRVIESYDRFFELQAEPPVWAYLDAARAWAGLGNEDRAFENLNLAVGRGWSNVGELKVYEEFEGLRDSQKWDNLVERMRQAA
jgi:RimJ/RimL family protein N-acetyltransferase